MPSGASTTSTSAVHTFALRIFRERGEAEEVVQDVFVQVWRQAETYSADRGTPEARPITMTRAGASINFVLNVDAMRWRDRRRTRTGCPSPPWPRARPGERRRARRSAGPGGPAGRAAQRPRARVLRRPHAERDRRATGRAARHGERHACARGARSGSGAPNPVPVCSGNDDVRGDSRAGGRRRRCRWRWNGAE